jgi:hypothetical protein
VAGIVCLLLSSQVFAQQPDAGAVASVEATPIAAATQGGEAIAGPSTSDPSQLTPVAVDPTSVNSAAVDNTAVAAAQPVEVSANPVAAELDPNSIPPIVFTYWEHEAINDARNAIGSVRPPTEEELMRDMQSSGLVEDKPKALPQDREIRLGGIVYINGKEWSIWLNEKRVTPDAIPPEVLDLKVYRGYVEMKWFDEFTNRILPLRLRAHERFNIDTRIFLPG